VARDGWSWRHDAKLVRALAKTRCVWLLFATLTCARRTSEREGHEAFQVFCRQAARRIGEHLWVAWGWGLQPLRDAFHVHALFGLPLGSSRSLVPADLQRLWTPEPQIDAYRPELGGVEYIARHPGTAVNVACPSSRPCGRKRGCLCAPGPWPKPAEQIAFTRPGYRRWR